MALNSGFQDTQRARRQGLVRRYAEATLFVAAWMVLARISGWDDPLRYQLLGIPLTAAFQAWVRRAPLRALWVREAPEPRFGSLFTLYVVGLSAMPLRAFVEASNRGSGSRSAFAAAALAGAFAAAYALRSCKRTHVRPFLICLASQGTIAAVLWALRAAAGHAPGPIAFLDSLALGFPLAFLVDEVSFRGAIDSHVYREGDRYAWGSALFVSTLWAVWHVPVMVKGSPETHVIAFVLFRIVLQPVFSLPLSMAWRQTGNLAIPAFFHMLVDAVAEAPS